MGHFYEISQEGIVPRYEVPNKSSGGLRSATLADARKHGWYPGITDVISVISKPQLVDWLQDNVATSAYHNPPLEFEDLESYKSRIRQDADRIGQKAADFGTRIHDCIEQFLTCGTDGTQLESDLAPFVVPTLEWLYSNVEKVIACESYVGCPKIGIAGRLDLHAIFKDYGEGICDFKSQKIRSGKAVFYKEWLKQLSAYNHLLPTGLTETLLSVVIDSGQPGPPQIKKWDNIEHAWKLFLYAFEIWKDSKDYDPSQNSFSPPPASNVKTEAETRPSDSKRPR